MLTEVQTRWMDKHPGATRLAALISLAALADPGLVRAARIALDLPVSAELDLRCSPLVASGSQAGLVLAEEALADLRARLDGPGLERAWQLTRARHDALSPALVLEETLTWESLAAAQAYAPEVAGPDAETRLNRALVAIVRGKQTQLAGWAARALPRLPAPVRELPSAKLLASAAQANGYRTSPTLGIDGPPPAWMMPQPPGSAQVQGSVAFFGSTLAISYPSLPGEPTLPLPENRRIWISWWRAQRRVWSERTVARGRTISVEVEGAQVVIEAPGFGRVVIEDQAAPWAEIATFGALDPSGRQLQQALRDRLAANGIRVVEKPDSVASRANSPNYLLVVTGPAQAGNMLGAMQTSAQQDWVRQSLAHCRPMIVLEAPGSPPLPALLSDEGLATFDCRDRAQWDERIDEVVKRVLAGPPALTEVVGAPGIPAVFVRRQALYEEMKSALLERTRSAPLVNVWGAEGLGRTMAVADLVRDCAIRRRFRNGIFWSRGNEAWNRGDRTSDDPWWHEELHPPYLIVLEDPPASQSDIWRLTGQMATDGGRCLLLTREKSARASSIDGTVWRSKEALDLFRKSVSAEENANEIDAALDLVGDVGSVLKSLPANEDFNLLPARSLANLGWLAGMTARSGERPELDVESFWEAFWKGGAPESMAQRDLLFKLDLVEPFAACPPGWKFAEPDDSIWLRYFAPAYRSRIIREAHERVRQAFPADDGLEIAPWVSRALVELALPTHGRIVQSYREECGGDWAICADDGYYLRFFAWHLFRTGITELYELVENIDWLIRAHREAPDWHKLLPENIETVQLLKYMRDGPTLDYFANSWIKDLQGWPTAFVPYRGQKMSTARLALRDGEPVRWILVIGTRNQLDPMLAILGECVGRELARWGYGLLTEGVPGVAALAEQAYTAQLKTNDFPPGTGVRDADWYANVNEDGPVAWEENEASEALAQNADAVVVIGGDKTMHTMQGILEAWAPIGLAKQPIPIGGSGGVAAEMAAKFTDMPNPESWATLNKKPESRADCYAMAKALITLLPENPSLSESGSR